MIQALREKIVSANLKSRKNNDVTKTIKSHEDAKE